MAHIEEFKASSSFHISEKTTEKYGFKIKPIDNSEAALDKFQKIVLAAISNVGNEYLYETVPDVSGQIKEVVFRRITF